eukprot:10345306-Alexandrium_andersonii.AAC.1
MVDRHTACNHGVGVSPWVDLRRGGLARRTRATEAGVSPWSPCCRLWAPERAALCVGAFIAISLRLQPALCGGKPFASS